MKTEAKIIETAKKVMADIDWAYDKSEPLVAVFTSIEEQFKRFQNFKGFEENKHKIYAYWTVSLQFPKEERWEGRNTYFILIKYEDGEPYEISHRQAKFKLIKDEDGKYKAEKY